MKKYKEALLKTPKPTPEQTDSGELVRGLRVPIFDTLDETDDGIESKSRREERYMIVLDIDKGPNLSPSKWVVHEYFQKVFLQIIGILLGLYKYLLQFV